ncbi:ankyrin repeat protein [Colletotrichum fioriniae PJ7]|uniref:Ankyrin repeat protein n=1 Tax=Colletotrichum fioriniae PJ7 TaxID=1445577 RepID=A0A010RJP1_9PEZI|nr:ankyrin repeat protein [Colletotrichum fioriniae PJ7]
MALPTWDAREETISSADDMANIYAKNIELRHPGTCNWFLRSQEYHQWKYDNSRTLFCVGPPGVGKSVLAAAVIDELRDRAVLFLFCESHTQEVDYLMRCLIRQLLTHAEHRTDIALLAQMRDLEEDENTRNDHDRAVLILLLRHCIKNCRSKGATVSLVLDGLDRLDLDVSRSFLSILSGLRDEINIGIFATSTLFASINTTDEAVMTIPIRASAEDLRSYAGKLSGMGIETGSDYKTSLDYITGCVCEISDGIFYAASCMVDSLLSLSKRHDIYLFLDDQYLNDIFDGWIEPHLEIPQVEYASDVIDWLTFSHRDLTTLELQHIISKHSSVRLEMDEIIDAMHGIIMTQTQGKQQSVRFFHGSLRKYLQRQKYEEEINIHDEIVRNCWDQLRGPVEQRFCISDEDFEERLRDKPLFSYAACYWGFHAERCSAPSGEALRFLTDRDVVERSNQAIWIEEHSSKEPGYSQRVPRNVEGLHLAAYFGLHYVAEKLLDEGTHSLSSIDTEGHTPLWWAAKFEMEKVVSLFCRSDTITLSLLIKADEEDLVETLLEGEYRINVTDAWRRTPLHIAVLLGRHRIASMLVEAKADVNVRDIKEHSPLYLAVSQGNRLLIDLLLKNNADGRDVDVKKFRALLSATDKDAIGIFMDQEEGPSGLRLPSPEDILKAINSRTGRCSIQEQNTAADSSQLYPRGRELNGPKFEWGRE